MTGKSNTHVSNVNTPLSRPWKDSAGSLVEIQGNCQNKILFVDIVYPTYRGSTVSALINSGAMPLYLLVIRFVNYPIILDLSIIYKAGKVSILH